MDRMSVNLALCLGLSVLTLSCTKNKEEKVGLPEKPIVSEADRGATGAPAEAAANAAPAAAQTPVDAPAPTTPGGEPAAPAPAAPQAQDSVQTRLTGEVSSQRKTNLAFRVTGFVAEIRAKPGDSCKKGDVLATLDARDYKLSADMARAQKEMAQVALANAKSEFGREEELRRQNVSTEAMYDKLKASYDKARLDLQLADLNLTKAEQALADTKLTAPYDCVVSKQLKYTGENVQSGNAVFEIYDTTDIELNFSVPERMAGKLKVGDNLTISIPATGFKGDVSIIRLVPVVEESSRTFKVITRAPVDQRIVPGLYAEATLR